MALQNPNLVSVLIIAILCFSPCYGEIEHTVHSKIVDDHLYIDSLGIKTTPREGVQTRRALVTKRKTFNINNFGAKGDGVTDDTQAFAKAWKSACSSSSSSGVVLLVPKNKNYLLKPITFSGPCKSDTTTIQIYGKILASNDRSDYEKDTRHWLQFEGIKNLVVDGANNGIIDGNGKIWWQNSCKINKNLPCKHAPTAITFSDCNNLVVKNLNVQNAQQMHVVFEKCVGVTASGLKVTSPENSPNTDGIHITNTQNIVVSSSVIGTGDDCISIVDGSRMVRALDITCGPGHGISIGSLGQGNSEAHVSNITVNGAKLSGTSNGVRIKTWQGGSGEASNIIFQNINLSNVKNPIIIDQNYCDQDKPCKNQGSAVKVRNVLYQNIKGTSSSEPAVTFDCSKNYPCQDITMQNVRIESNEDGKTSEATCKNVKLTEIGAVSPHCSST